MLRELIIKLSTQVLWVIHYIEPYINYMVDFIRIKYNYLMNKNVKPQGEWLCLVYTNGMQYYEYFMLLKNNETPHDGIKPYKNDSFLWIKRVKREDGQIINIYNNETMYLTDEDDGYEYSSVKFFMIIFKQNDKVIPITITKGDYIVGNNILSRKHIIHYMKYENIAIDINKEYTITIMDNKSATIHIDNTQCILLCKNTYMIKKPDVDDNDENKNETECKKMI